MNVNLNDFFKDPITAFEKITQMKPEEAIELFKKLNSFLNIKIEEKKEEEVLEETSTKEYTIPPDQWL